MFLIGSSIGCGRGDGCSFFFKSGSGSGVILFSAYGNETSGSGKGHSKDLNSGFGYGDLYDFNHGTGHGSGFGSYTSFFFGQGYGLGTVNKRRNTFLSP